jgi:hypothetical protein
MKDSHDLSIAGLRVNFIFPLPPPLSTFLLLQHRPLPVDCPRLRRRRLTAPPPPTLSKSSDRHNPHPLNWCTAIITNANSPIDNATSRCPLLHRIYHQDSSMLPSSFTKFTIGILLCYPPLPNLSHPPRCRPCSVRWAGTPRTDWALARNSFRKMNRGSKGFTRWALCALMYTARTAVLASLFGLDCYASRVSVQACKL